MVVRVIFFRKKVTSEALSFKSFERTHVTLSAKIFSSDNVSTFSSMIFSNKESFESVFLKRKEEGRLFLRSSWPTWVEKWTIFKLCVASIVPHKMFSIAWFVPEQRGRALQSIGKNGNMRNMNRRGSGWLPVVKLASFSQHNKVHNLRIRLILSKPAGY